MEYNQNQEKLNKIIEKNNKNNANFVNKKSEYDYQTNNSENYLSPSYNYESDWESNNLQSSWSTSYKDDLLLGADTFTIIGYIDIPDHVAPYLDVKVSVRLTDPKYKMANCIITGKYPEGMGNTHVWSGNAGYASGTVEICSLNPAPQYYYHCKYQDNFGEFMPTIAEIALPATDFSSEIITVQKCKKSGYENPYKITVTKKVVIYGLQNTSSVLRLEQKETEKETRYLHVEPPTDPETFEWRWVDLKIPPGGADVTDPNWYSKLIHEGWLNKAVYSWEIDVQFKLRVSFKKPIIATTIKRVSNE